MQEPPLNIKDPEVYRMARQLADRTGQSLTAAVRQALREKLEREMRRDADPLLIDKLREISDRCAAEPILDSRTDDEILGYDDRGLPH